MTTPAIAPDVTTYAARTPYLTNAEWMNAPTALDINDLLPNADEDAQQQALSDAIGRASSWVDDLCGPMVLAATRDVHLRRYRVNRDGVILVPLPFKPVLEVSAVSVGPRPSLMQPLTDLSDVAFPGNGVIEVPLHSLFYGPGANFGAACGIGSRPLVQVTYVNGWPNTLTSADADSGDTALELESALGIYPGTTMTVYDGESTEQVTIGDAYTPGVTTVPLVSPLANAHSAGISVSSLPPKVKEAAILLTNVVIQARGNDAIILDTTENPGKASGEFGASTESVALATSMLASLRRVW